MRCRSNHNRINPQSAVQTQLKRDAVNEAAANGVRKEKGETKPQETKENAEQSKNENRNMKNERMLVNCSDNKKFNTLSDITICN